MTTIAVRRLAGSTGVVFCSDDQATHGHEISSGVAKVFQVGPVTFGVAGMLRDLNLLQFQLKVPAYTAAAKKDPERWVVTKLVPAIRTTFFENGQIRNKEGMESMHSGILLSVDGLCGELDTSFSLSQMTSQFWSLGSGAEYAKGAMALGATAREAVDVASSFDAYTGPSSEVVVVRWT